MKSVSADKLDVLFWLTFMERIVSYLVYDRNTIGRKNIFGNTSPSLPFVSVRLSLRMARRTRTISQ